MKPSDCYMIGWNDGCAGRERNEVQIPEAGLVGLAAYGDGFEEGAHHRQKALRTASHFDCLTTVNEAAFSMWNLGSHPELPDPPSGSGCEFHYCWMPVDTRKDNHLCKAHGGKDALLPKAKVK